MPSAAAMTRDICRCRLLPDVVKCSGAELLLRLEDGGGNNDVSDLLSLFLLFIVKGCPNT